MSTPHLLGRRAAPLVAATYKENVQAYIPPWRDGQAARFALWDSPCPAAPLGRASLSEYTSASSAFLSENRCAVDDCLVRDCVFSVRAAILRVRLLSIMSSLIEFTGVQQPR